MNLINYFDAGGSGFRGEVGDVFMELLQRYYRDEPPLGRIGYSAANNSIIGFTALLGGLSLDGGMLLLCSLLERYDCGNSF